MKELFDSTAPLPLKNCQLWFASIITQPIDCEQKIPKLAPSGQPIEEEAKKYIVPSPTLRPAERIELYAQQYWWRLMNVMHDTFPLVTRLFGYHDFNITIAIPYLLKYPPNHWSLNCLGDRLPTWIQEDYQADDKHLVYEAAILDLAYLSNFLVPEMEALELNKNVMPISDDFSELLEKKLYLQSHVCFFEFDHDLFSFRMDFLKESPEYWLENDFPVLKEAETPFVLFRNQGGYLVWDTISKAEMLMLKRFVEGSTVDELCEWLEEQNDEVFAEAEERLPFWIQGWVIKRWLSMNPN